MFFCCKREFKEHASTHVWRERERESCLFVCLQWYLALKAWLDIRWIESVAVSAVHDATWSCDMRECYYVASFALVNASQLMGILLRFYCLSAPALMMLMEGKCGLLSWYDFLWLEEGKKNHLSLSKVAAAQHRSQAIRFGALSSCRCVFMWLTISIRRISDFSGRRRRRVQRRV